jgi:hypothetical protein
MSRAQRSITSINFSRKSIYDWDKLIGSKTLERNKWLVKVWSDLYFANQNDEFLRNLSTDDIMKTKWFEKYGIKEVKF